LARNAVAFLRAQLDSGQSMEALAIRDSVAHERGSATIRRNIGNSNYAKVITIELAAGSRSVAAGSGRQVHTIAQTPFTR
jgi:hypothetical protein